MVSVEEVYNHFRYLLVQLIAEEFDMKIRWPGWDDKVVSATQRYVTALQEAAWGRILFVTERGYIGLGPLSSFAGDDVAVLCGGKTPYVLFGRDQDSTSLHLVGEAYVHGLMDGEAFQGTAQAKVIELV